MWSPCSTAGPPRESPPPSTTASRCSGSWTPCATGGARGYIDLVEQTYFRRGFGLKGDIEGALAVVYHSRVVDRIRAQGYVLAVGDLTVKLAREFGFCYGVDRAVEYAYETRTKFPERRVFPSGLWMISPTRNTRRSGNFVRL